MDESFEITPVALKELQQVRGNNPDDVVRVITAKVTMGFGYGVGQFCFSWALYSILVNCG